MRGRESKTQRSKGGGEGASLKAKPGAEMDDRAAKRLQLACFSTVSLEPCEPCGAQLIVRTNGAKGAADCLALAGCTLLQRLAATGPLLHMSAHAPLSLPSSRHDASKSVRRIRQPAVASRPACSAPRTRKTRLEKVDAPRALESLSLLKEGLRDQCLGLLVPSSRRAACGDEDERERSRELPSRAKS